MKLIAERTTREGAESAAYRAWEEEGRRGHPVIIWHGDRPTEGPRGGMSKLRIFSAYLCCLPEKPARRKASR